MDVIVVRAGQFTTVQDLGRTGRRAAGVPVGGAMDAFALRVANLLVGNAEHAAALEFAFTGPELTFSADTVVALGGAEFDGLPRWQPVRVRAGERLALGGARSGCRGYLAIAGGLAIEPVLGGRGTYLRAGFGGWEGRLLREGDVLRAQDAVREVGDHWRVDARILPAYSAAPAVRVTRGAQCAEFGQAFWSAEFRVTPQSDRMGLRLQGPKLERADAEDRLSSAVAPGTIQVPPDGQPIVLMADAQTIGGYPQLAHVITADLPLLAQLRPGDTVRFSEVTLDEAQRQLLARERTLGLLREGLAQKIH